MLVAGEASGDLHAANLARALKRLRPDIHCFGMGAKGMRAAGVEILIDSSRLAVVGLIEVLAHYREIKAALRTLQATLKARRPDLLILVDYPEFNLKLAATARECGVKVLYYISPQVWAWRPGRVKKIAALVDHMAVVFPFEAPIYEQAGVPVTFVGHPLVDEASPSMSRDEALRQFDLDNASTVVGLFPGSRKSELDRLLPVLIESARLLRERFENVQFVLPIAPTFAREDLEVRLKDSKLPITLIEDQTYDVIQACDAIITASGTATLQIALIGTPMAVVYRVSSLSYWIVKRLVTLKHIALANIVAGEAVVREFIQNEARPAAIADEIARILTDGDYARSIRRGLKQVRKNLGASGGSEKIARLVLEILEQPDRA